MSPFALSGPAMSDGTKRLKDTPGPHAQACLASLRAAWRCALAQAGSAPMTRFSGIAMVDRPHLVAGRREP
jgi:hypothetical protein